MPREGREFEQAYEWLYSLDDRFKVTSPAFLYDRAAGIDREIDVLVEYTDAQGIHRKISIECRDRKAAQNVMWIEQLQQKREDIGLDYIIATTTSKFSDAAIRKAKYHGVILEQAEMLGKATVDNLPEFFFDAFFLNFELLEMNLYTTNHGKMSLAQYMKDINVMERAALLQHINTEFYFSIDPYQVLEANHISREDFYAKEDNSIEMSGNNILPADKKPPFFKNVMIIEWRIRALPIKISLPLCDSISVFDGETHSNKDYRAIYGNDEDYFRIGYLDGKLFTELQLKKRQHKRFVSANLELNTIIPEGIDMRFDKDFDYIAHNLLGEFDLSALGI